MYVSISTCVYTYIQNVQVVFYSCTSSCLCIVYLCIYMLKQICLDACICLHMSYDTTMYQHVYGYAPHMLRKM